MSARVLALPTLLYLLCTGALAQTSLLRNAGFETVANGNISDWTCPDYWSGRFAPVDDATRAHSGRRAAQLSATLKGDRHWGRVHTVQVSVDYGLNYAFSVWARGSGTLKLGAINYSQRGEKTEYMYTWQAQPVALTDQWQQVSLAVSPLDAGVQKIALAVEVAGENAAALLDDAEFSVTREGPGSVEMLPYQMLPVGKAVTLGFAVQRQDQPLKEGKATALVVDSRTATLLEVTLDAAGKGSVAVPASTEPGLVKVTVVNGEIGGAATAYLDTVDQATYDAFAAAAARVRPGPLPAHLLFLGDSLTDFLRGQNYTDQVSFWLNQVHGGQVTYRNAGVGGDYITRVQQRMDADPKVYRPDAYKDLYNPRPTRVFIMLGHNDSKLSSTSGFVNTCVPIGEFRTVYAEVLKRLKQETGGVPVLVLSATSGVYEITKANADKAVAAGRGASLFSKPETLELFNAATRDIAAAAGAEYLDVYTPTRTHPDMAGLFVADGVHLSLAGNHLIALEILKHLGR